jgi:hypothetical protein
MTAPVIFYGYYRSQPGLSCAGHKIVLQDENLYWVVDAVMLEEISGKAGNTAVFGRFIYVLTKLRKAVTSHLIHNLWRRELE